MLQRLSPMPPLDFSHARRGRDARRCEADTVQVAIAIESHHGADGGLNRSVGADLQQHDRLPDLDSLQASIRPGAPAPFGALLAGGNLREVLRFEIGDIQHATPL
jgi:hypothetical protein